MAALESIGPAGECIVNKIKYNLKVQHPSCACITRNDKGIIIAWTKNKYVNCIIKLCHGLSDDRKPTWLQVNPREITNSRAAIAGNIAFWSESCKLMARNLDKPILKFEMLKQLRTKNLTSKAMPTTIIISVKNITVLWKVMLSGLGYIYAR